MNKKFTVDTATGYEQILQSFVTKKCATQGFSRQDVESYINKFMPKITCHPPAVVDSTRWAHTWFIDGLQNEKFRLAVREHDKKIVENTCELIVTIYRV